MGKLTTLATEISNLLLTRARSGCIESIKFLAERRCCYQRNGGPQINITTQDTPMLNIYFTGENGSVKNLRDLHDPQLLENDPE